MRENIKNNSAKVYLKVVLLSVGILMTGLLLMVAVYMLPVGRMKSHIADSDELFNYEGIYPQVMQGYKCSQLDNYTDGLMYATAIHPGSGNPLQDALRNARYEYEDTNMVQSLNDYANDVSSKEGMRYEMIYPRYWHGYLVILKPLLLFFNVSEIRMLSMIAQGALLLFLLFQIRRRLGEQYQIPVLMMAAVLNPIVLPLSLQFSWVYYVGLLGAIGIMSMKEPVHGEKYIFLFLLLGMVTSYLDLLTYPLFTLGLPLVLFLLVEKKQNWKGRMGLMVRCSIIWAIGYAVMWAGKWIFAFLFARINLFSEVAGKILQRTSMVGEEEEKLTAITVIWKNIQVISEWPFLIMFIIFIISCLAIWLYSKNKWPDRNAVLMRLPYLIVAIMPIVWIALMSNHSWVHYWFTYRELSVTVLAGAVWLMEILIPKRVKMEEKVDG